MQKYTPCNESISHCIVTKIEVIFYPWQCRYTLTMSMQKSKVQLYSFYIVINQYPIYPNKPNNPDIPDIADIPDIPDLPDIPDISDNQYQYEEEGLNFLFWFPVTGRFPVLIFSDFLVPGTVTGFSK